MSGSERTFSRRDWAVFAGVVMLVFGLTTLLASPFFLLRYFPHLPGSAYAILACVSLLIAFAGFCLLVGSLTVLLGIAMIAVGTIGFLGGLESFDEVSRFHQEMERMGWSSLPEGEEQKLDTAKKWSCCIFLGILVPIGIVVVVRGRRDRTEDAFWPDCRSR